MRTQTCDPSWTNKRSTPIPFNKWKRDVRKLYELRCTLELSETCTLTCMRTYEHSLHMCADDACNYTQICTHTYMCDAQRRKYIDACIHISEHTHTHTCMHGPSTNINGGDHWLLIQPSGFLLIAQAPTRCFPSTHMCQPKEQRRRRRIGNKQTNEATMT